MPIGLIGQKCGMTRVFNTIGSSTPVTVVQILSNYITQIKTINTDGYNAVQVTTGIQKKSRINRPLSGHFSKACIPGGTGLWEFRILRDEEMNFSLGQKITVSLFKTYQMVDAIGYSKGHGFTGVIKRYNFKSQRATHGNSLSHNAPGSIGQNQTPGKVFKGKKMAGRMGNVRTTIHNLRLVKIYEEKGILLLNGAVPGHINGKIIIMPSIKVKKIVCEKK